MESISLEVESNDNCHGLPLLVFEAHREPRKAIQVRIYRRGGESDLHWVTGWSSDGDGSPCPAQCVPISDSGTGIAHLLYGGDWGIRLKPVASSEEWDINAPSQWGEPYMVLSDENDVVMDPSG